MMVAEEYELTFQVGDIVEHINLPKPERYLIVELYGNEKSSLCDSLCLDTGKHVIWRYENMHMFCRKVA